MGREPQHQRLANSPALRADEARRILTFASPRLWPRGRGAWPRPSHATKLSASISPSRCPAARSTSSSTRLRSSPSLGQGLDRLARYGRLLSDRVAARTHRKGESLLLLVHDTGTTPLHPARAEFALAVALKLARDCTGADITPLRVCFAHPAPDNTSEHRRFFHGNVRFAAGSSSMSLSAADASRPMREADAALAGIIRRRLEKALEDRDRSSAGAMSTRVSHILVEHLGQSVLTLDAVATALAVSPRTLTRRLAEERASFRHILDEVRGDFARALVQDRSLSIRDIAFFLHTPNQRRSTGPSCGGPVGRHARSERPDRSHQPPPDSPAIGSAAERKGQANSPISR